MTSAVESQDEAEVAPYDPLRLCIFATVALLGWLLGPVALLGFAVLGLVGYTKAYRAGLTRSKCFLRDTRLVIRYLALLAVAGAAGVVVPGSAARARAPHGFVASRPRVGDWVVMSERTPLPLVFDEPRGRKKPPRHLADLSAAERKTLLSEAGLPGFRAKQLSTHYFARLVDDPAEMTDLPAAERERLVEALLPTLMTPLRTLEADKGTTRKTLWKLFDGALVESVLMRYPGRGTMCVSSQAGCGMACPFCATGQGGLSGTCPPPRSSSRSRRARGRWPATRSRAAPAACTTSSSWAWASRWPTTRRSSAPYAG